MPSFLLAARAAGSVAAVVDRLGMPRLVYLSGVGVVLVALAPAFTDWAIAFSQG
jgi:hypothetical protein